MIWYKLLRAQRFNSMTHKTGNSIKVLRDSTLKKIMFKNDPLTGDSGKCICSILKFIVQFLNDFIVKGCVIKAKLKYTCVFPRSSRNNYRRKNGTCNLRLTMISVCLKIKQTWLQNVYRKTWCSQFHMTRLSCSTFVIKNRLNTITHSLWSTQTVLNSKKGPTKMDFINRFALRRSVA